MCRDLVDGGCHTVKHIDSLAFGPPPSEKCAFAQTVDNRQSLLSLSDLATRLRSPSSEYRIYANRTVDPI